LAEAAKIQHFGFCERQIASPPAHSCVAGKEANCHAQIMNGPHQLTLHFFGLIALVFCRAAGSDWPQFLGPRRDAVYAGP